MSTISASTTSTTAFKITTDTTGALVFQTGASPTTAMTLDTSQNTTLAGNIRLNNGTADGAQLSLASSGYSDWNIDNYSGNFRWYYNATEYMRLDNAGNLGIGVSPSASWSTGSGAVLQMPAGSVWNYSTSQMNIASNYYFDGTNYRYKVNGTASSFDQASGSFFWKTAASGTAGNSISFIQAMTLDASGYLAIGSTTTAARFKAALTGASTASITTVSDFGAASVLSLGGIGSNSQGVYLGTGDAQTGTSSGIAAGIGFLREASGWNSALAFYTNGTTDGSTTNRITERARIDSSGNFIVGVAGSGGNPVRWPYTSASASSRSWAIRNDWSNFGDLAFVQSTTQTGTSFDAKMTLDSSGNLLVGDTSAYGGSRLSVKTGNNNGTTHAWYAKNSSATVLGYQRDDGLFNTGAATNSPYNFTTASAANLFVDSSGTIYRSTSSLKYKTDVQDATHGLAKVLSLRSVTYKGKNDGNTVFGGLIAEEVHAAGLTEFVQYAEDGTPDALAYGQMVSLAFKAIQEQQAIIEQLRADVETLKGAA